MFASQLLYPGTIEELKSDCLPFNSQALERYNQIQNMRNCLYADVALVVASLAAVIFSSSFATGAALGLAAVVGVVVFSHCWERWKSLTGDLHFNGR